MYHIFWKQFWDFFAALTCEKRNGNPFGNNTFGIQIQNNQQFCHPKAVLFGTFRAVALPLLAANSKAHIPYLGWSNWLHGNDNLWIARLVSEHIYNRLVGALSAICHVFLFVVSPTSSGWKMKSYNYCMHMWIKPPISISDNITIYICENSSRLYNIGSIGLYFTTLQPGMLQPRNLDDVSALACELQANEQTLNISVTWCAIVQSSPVVSNPYKNSMFLKTSRIGLKLKPVSNHKICLSFQAGSDKNVRRELLILKEQLKDVRCIAIGCEHQRSHAMSIWRQRQATKLDPLGSMWFWNTRPKKMLCAQNILKDQTCFHHVSS